MHVTQKTVNGTTCQLKRFKTDKKNAEYEYYLIEDGEATAGPKYTKSEAMDLFNKRVESLKSGGKQGFDPSLPGGDFDYNPTMPGFGDPDNDDSNPPWAP